MAIKIKAPAFPESVADGEIALWHKEEGDTVTRDELMVEIETDKVVMEVVAPEDGVLTKIHAQAGDVIESEQLLADLQPGATGSKVPASGDSDTVSAAPVSSDTSDKAAMLGPAARQLVEEHKLDINDIAGSGKNGRITKDDVVQYMKAADSKPSKAAVKKPAAEEAPLTPSGERIEKRVPMTRMRAKIAERLLQASQETAMLTTFNEVNMAPVMALRSKYKDQFEKTHNGTRLGFMGFFVKAACEALKRFPDVNASIDGNDVIYHGYQDIGVAVRNNMSLHFVLYDMSFIHQRPFCGSHGISS